MLEFNSYCFIFYKHFDLEELPNKFENSKQFWEVSKNFKEKKVRMKGKFRIFL